MLELCNVSYQYPAGETPALANVSLSLLPGQLAAVVGPNGSGKTTLLRIVLGIARATSGEVQIEGRPVDRWSRRELAQTFGVVSQREETTFPLRVRQSVSLGRYPHLGGFAAPRDHDRRMVDEAMRKCDVEQLAHRWINNLSGGEWQRVRIARALAQEPRALILDEPSANLDLRHEMEVFELTAGLVHERGLAAVIVTHNVNLAARYADTMLVLNGGTTRAFGPPHEVLNVELMHDVFRWPVDV
ncbi:MAG: ABC transporter ATP-binding protein, partial [Gemmatimonadales bacterium]